MVLVLEDLHWSDYATLDLLAVLARRQESARLLVLGTYRPEEVLGKGHPLATLTQELQIHGHSQELPLTLLTKAAVRAYLEARLPDAAITDELVQCIHQRTEGNPLFMANMVDYVVAQDMPSALMGSRSLPGRAGGSGARDAREPATDARAPIRPAAPRGTGDA